MGKRIYKAKSIAAIEVSKLREQVGERVIVGCDAAKDTWYAAIMKEDGTVLQTIKWHRVDDHRKLMDFIEQLQETAVVEVAVEPTGTYADPVVYQLLQSGVPVYRVSPKHSHDYSEIYDGVPSSHDGKSAAVVAKLHLEGKSKDWKFWSEEQRELRAQATQVDWRTQEIQRNNNRLESGLSRHWPELQTFLRLDSAGMRALIMEYGSPAEVARNEEEARELLRTSTYGQLSKETANGVMESARNTIGVPVCEEERKLIKVLGAQLITLYQEQKKAATSFEEATTQMPSTTLLTPHLGKMTAGVLVGVLGALTDYDSARALLHAAGLNLRVRSSGKHKGTLRLAKRGSSVARRWLFLATLRWLRNPTVNAWYKRKVEHNGGNKMKAIVALMRKLLAGMYHVARGEQLDLGKLLDTRGLNIAT